MIAKYFERDEGNSTPLFLRIFLALQLAGTLILVRRIMTPFLKNTNTFDPNLVPTSILYYLGLLEIIIGITVLIGLWHMRRWALYGYSLVLLLSIPYSMNYFGIGMFPFKVLIPVIFVGFLYKMTPFFYWKRFT